MEVLRLKSVEVTDSWAVEFMAATWSQGGSLSLLLLLAVHFLWDRKSSLREPSLHFLVGKWFLTDPDRALWVINHFENHNSLGLAPSLVFSPGRPTDKSPAPCSLSPLYTLEPLLGTKRRNRTPQTPLNAFRARVHLLSL